MSDLQVRALVALEEACRRALVATDVKTCFHDALDRSNDRATLDLAYKALQLVGYEEANCNTVAEMTTIVRHAVICLRAGALR